MNRFLCLIFAVGCLGCAKTSDRKSHEIARVGERVLTLEELAGILPEDATAQDSLRITQDFINRWALKQLLFQTAEENLSDAQKAEFDGLVERYRNDLYTQSYLRELVNQKVDTVVRTADIEAIYDQHTDQFKADQRFYKLRVAKLTPKAAADRQLKSRFFSTKSDDKDKIEQERIKFAFLSLNDTTWIDKQSLGVIVPMSKFSNQLQAGRSLEAKDSFYVYWIKVKDIVQEGARLPEDLAQKEVKSWIVAQRKEALLKQLEKEIVRNAINTKEYEIFK